MKQDTARPGSKAGNRSHAEPLALIESLRWEGRFLRLEQHLARLQHSAGKLGFRFSRASAERALQELAGTLEPAVFCKVRLLLTAEGEVQVAAGPLGSPAGEMQTVQLADISVDSSDELLRHKTTRRQLFDLAGARADSLGLADLLFCNETGEVTEGSRNNLFIRSNGRLVTPPVEAGLLPGVYRSVVLADNPDVLIRPLPLAELLQAEAVFLCNSVRGWRQVSFITEMVNLGVNHG